MQKTRFGSTAPRVTGFRFSRSPERRAFALADKVDAVKIRVGG